MHLPHLIPAFEHYLWVLKTTHAGADLDVAMEMAQGHMDGDLAWTIRCEKWQMSSKHLRGIGGFCTGALQLPFTHLRSHSIVHLYPTPGTSWPTAWIGGCPARLCR